MSPHSRLAAFAATALLLSAPLIGAAQGLTPGAIGQARALGILDDKASRSPAEKKINDRLLFAQRAMQRGARRNTETPGVPEFVQHFINGQTNDDQTTYVSIRASSTAQLTAWLKANGARDVNEYAENRNVTAYVPVSSLIDLANRADVLTIGPRELAETHRYFPELDAKRQPAGSALDAVPNTGSTVWKGVTAHKADKAHQTGITGAGVKVCVMSDGVNSLASRQAAGELPPVQVLVNGTLQSGNGDEGTAMLEIVADMAPGASLGFATAFNGPSSFASNIRLLQSSMGCHIIVDDVSYFYEAAFNDDDIARAVNDVTAAGVLYFSSAANSGNLTHGNSGTYEGDFNQSASALPAVISATGETGVLHQFPSGLPYTTLATGPNTGSSGTSIITLKWSDASDNSSNDYDLYVTNSTGTTILGFSAFGSGGAGFQPYELATCDVAGPGPCDSGGSCNPSTGAFCRFPVGARIYVVKFSGANRAIRIDASRGVIAAADRTTGSTFGHNAANSAFTVAASFLTSVSGTAPFDASKTVTYYSSDGPRKIFYTYPTGGAATPISPANFLFGTGGGTTLPKVDLTAGDCGATTTPGFTTFCGTSAAAPTAAAIAALIKSAKPTATKAQLTAALLASAIDNEAAGTDRDSGVGIVMADASVKGILTALVYGKSFSPATIIAGGTSTLTITIQNTNAIDINGVALTDTYPTGIVNAAIPNAAMSGAGCTASLAATGAGHSLAITNATIPAGTTCTFTVVVTVPAAGLYSDSGGTISTPIGLNTSSPTGSLTVIATTNRAFVSAFGDDANIVPNACSFASPCRTFSAAQTVLNDGGEIIALNGAGYGAITITKSMSIIANSGFYAGISAPSGDAVTIATPGVSVLLRGLNINGVGGVNGVNMTAGTALTLQNCVVSNFTGSGVIFDASGSSLRVLGSVFSGNGVDGLTLANGRADVTNSRATNNGRGGFMAFTTGSGATAALSIADSFAGGNQTGFGAVINATGSNARINATRVSGVSNAIYGLQVQFMSGNAAAGIVSDSMFSQNQTAGMYNGGGSSLKSLGNNLVDLNGVNTSGPITTVGGQ